MKLRSDGDFVWAISFGGSGNDAILSVDVLHGILRHRRVTADPQGMGSEARPEPFKSRTHGGGIACQGGGNVTLNGLRNRVHTGEDTKNSPGSLLQDLGRRGRLKFRLPRSGFGRFAEGLYGGLLPSWEGIVRLGNSFSINASMRGTRYCSFPAASEAQRNAWVKRS